MKWASHPRTRFLIAFIAIVVAAATFVTRMSRDFRNRRGNILSRIAPTPSASQLPTETIQPTVQASPPALQSPTMQAGVGATSSPSPPASAILLPAGTPSNLIIPVAGVRSDQLHDTFSDSRSEGRVHDAIDIPAPRDTPVLAAADGTILRLFQSDRGGTTVYQLSTDGKFVYYYAHLERYADGLDAGHFAKQGETIAYVGDTGNAGAGNYHLHFSISVVSDPKRYWEGTNINPYPLLRK